MTQLVRIGRLMGSDRRGAVVPWTPANLGASLLAWWTADRSDLITLSGAQVTSFKDTVAAYNLVQSVAASRPLYSATGFNGAPGVTFDGTDDELTMASSPFPMGSVGAELWSLADQQALVADTGARVMCSYGGLTGSQTRVLYRSVVSAQNRVTGYASSVTANFAGDFSGRHSARAIVTPTNITAGMDGSLGTSSAVVPDTASARTRMGANAASPVIQFWKGVIRDVLFTSLLSAGDAVLLNAYLDSRRMP